MGERAQRAPTRALINGRWHALTPGQGARLAVAEARARDTVQKVRERAPDWRPTPFLTQNVEGQIRGVEGEAREAQARLLELQRAGIGPGRFAAESIPARGPEQDFKAAERRDLNRIGGETGCHTCGTIDPGTSVETLCLTISRRAVTIRSIASSGFFRSAWPVVYFRGGWIRQNG